MKKVAILTTHRANNFGAQLQAFSLVSTVRMLGVEAEILDWRTPHFEFTYHKANHFSWACIRHPRLVIYYLRRFFWFRFGNKRISELFDAFRMEYPISEKYERRKDLKNIANLYDYIIVGSDQVWNPLNTASDKVSFDRTYLLDFCDDSQKKRAYAASLGTAEITPKSLIPEFKNLLSDFSVITVREFSGAELVNKLIGIRPKVVLDPVLLQSRIFWETCFDKESVPQKPYVFIYNMHRSEILRKNALNYARERRLSVLEVVLPSRPEQSWSQRITPVFAGPRQFLALVANAEAVFTASFHASAFSVLFHRKLFVELRDEKDNSNCRMDTLFQIAGVKTNVTTVFQEGCVKINRLLVNDWSSADFHIEVARKESINCLKAILGLSTERANEEN